jgi:predicted NUDIX family phosphoesterase/thymidylate kinase
MTQDIEREVNELESRAKKLRGLLKYAPRPFVIEFAGTPKSGKTTSVETIRHFLSRHGFRVHVLAERAAVCPIPMKGHLFFNTWCATSMLAELLANIEADTDIIIVDRGLFDALVWLALQERRGELTGDEARKIESFLLLERWCTLTDLVVVMAVSAEEALARENRQRITQKPGSIMNPEVLASISEAVDQAHDRYHKYFQTSVKHVTSGEDIRLSSIRLANELLDSLEHFLNPKVLVVPRKEIERLVSDTNGGFADDAFQKALSCTKNYGSFIGRDEAENRDDVVQIVTAGVLVLDDRVFLFQRRETDPKYRLYGKTTIWQGSHVQYGHGDDIGDLLRVTLQSRLSRSLFLSRVFQTQEVGYCWDANDPKSSHHLGMMYSIKIDNPHTAADLRKKEFRRKRGESLVGEFVSWEDLAQKANDLNLESWSRALLESRKVS